MKSSNDATGRSEGAPAALAELIQGAWRQERFLRRLAALYGRLQRQANARNVQCMGGGCCCRFDLAGHRLYVSTGELAMLALAAPPYPQRSAKMRCPYQQGPRCLARERRPLGCRLFFCRSEPGQSQQQYERYHRLIRRLHDRAGLEYRYLELTSALLRLSETQGPPASGPADSGGTSPRNSPAPVV